jgi:hypothetical protein
MFKMEKGTIEIPIVEMRMRTEKEGGGTSNT